MGHFVGSQMKSEHKVTAVVTSTHAAWMWAWWYFLTHFFQKSIAWLFKNNKSCHEYFPTTSLKWYLSENVPIYSKTLKLQYATSADRLSVKTRHVCRETEIGNVLYSPMFMYCNGLNTSPAWAALLAEWGNVSMFSPSIKSHSPTSLSQM